MSGFEIAGIVLAALPFLVEFSQASKKKYSSTLNALIPTTKKEAQLNNSLKHFYVRLQFEMVITTKMLGEVFNRLPNNISPTEMMAQLVESEKKYGGCLEKSVQAKLDRVFRTEMELSLFFSLAEELLEILSDFQGLKLPKGKKNHKRIIKTIKSFESAKQKPFWNFKARRKFLEEEEVRHKLLNELAKANKMLTRLVQLCNTNLADIPSNSNLDSGFTNSAHPPGISINDAPMSQRTSTALEEHLNKQYYASAGRIRATSSRLFTAMKRLWSCNCDQRHDVGFCLSLCGLERTLALSSQNIPGFDLVVWKWNDSGLNRTGWREAMVTISSKTKTEPHLGTFIPKNEVESPGTPITKASLICDTLEVYWDKKGAAFRLHIEDSRNETKLMEPVEIRAQKLLKYSCSQDPPPTATLKQLFCDPYLLKQYKRPPQMVRLKLATTLACSLFQLYESPWSSSRWDKAYLSFFLTTSGSIDYDNPYLNTAFDEGSFQEDTTPGPSPVHPKIGLLKLGILLLEIFKWKSIEELLKDKDQTNTDCLLDAEFFAALRLCKRYYHRSENYFRSVRGCLDMPWREDMDAVSFEDAKTREGFYENVIMPLALEMKAEMVGGCEPEDDLQSVTSSSTGTKSRSSRKSSRKLR